MSTQRTPRRGLVEFLDEPVQVKRLWWYVGLALIVMSAVNTTLAILSWLLDLVVRGIS